MKEGIIKLWEEYETWLDEYRFARQEGYDEQFRSFIRWLRVHHE